MKKNNKTNLKAMITTMLVLALVLTLIPVSAQASSKWTNSISKTKKITDEHHCAYYVIEVKKTCEVTVTGYGTTGCMAWDIKKNMNDTDKAMPTILTEKSKYNSKTGMSTDTYKLYKGYYAVGAGVPKANYMNKISIKSSGKNIRFVKAYYSYNTVSKDDFDYLDAYYDKEDICW